MAQIYSDPKRAPHVFDVTYTEAEEMGLTYDDDHRPAPGWYYWPNMPNDGTPPIGPFPTEAEAIADAQGEGE
jgi:hypothetical protein